MYESSSSDRAPEMTFATSDIQTILQKNIMDRYNGRMMSDDEWIETHGSGTLRKNKRLGFAWKSQYREERTAFEFGWEFQMVAKTRVTLGLPQTEGDCHAVTESGWHIDRYMSVCNVLSDQIKPAYITISDAAGEGSESRQEGIGMVLTPSFPVHWVPSSHMIVCIIAHVKPDHSYDHPRNPC